MKVKRQILFNNILLCLVFHGQICKADGECPGDKECCVDGNCVKDYPKSFCPILREMLDVFGLEPGK